MHFLIFGLWTLELLIFDLNIGFYVKFPPMGRVLRSQFWRGGRKIKKIKELPKDWPTVTKAHAVLASSCGLNFLMHRSAALANNGNSFLGKLW